MRPSQPFDPEARYQRRRPAWDPFDPNVLSVVDPNSQLGRDLAISLQATAEQEAEASGNTISLTDEQIESITEKLPRLTEADLERLGHKDASCSICLNTFLACLAEEEIAYAMDSPAQPVEDRGVTHLAETCGHVFCRKELSAICRCRIPQFQSLNPCANRAKISLLSWIRDRNSACPLCRARLFESSLDSATVTEARNRIIRAWRVERQILNGDQLRSTDFGY